MTLFDDLQVTISTYLDISETHIYSGTLEQILPTFGHVPSSGLVGRSRL